MSLPPAWPECSDFFGRPIAREPSHGQLSGGAGLLPVRQFDERIGLTQGFADALEDPRDPDLTGYTFRFVADSFRLYPHAAAMNLLVRLRRFIAEPLPAPAPPAGTVTPPTQSGEAAPRAEETCLPAAALAGAERQRPFRLRRQRDPLGEGHPRTWRTLLIMVAAEVVVRARRIVVRLSSSWPHPGWYRRVCERLRAPSRFPFPILRADPLVSPLRCLPRVGVRGRSVPVAGPGRSSVTNGLGMPSGGCLATRGLNNPG